MEVLEAKLIVELVNGTFFTTPNEYHQDQMVAYQRSTSSKDVIF
jgi:hypothetical protein